MPPFIYTWRTAALVHSWYQQNRGQVEVLASQEMNALRQGKRSFSCDVKFLTFPVGFKVHVSKPSGNHIGSDRLRWLVCNVTTGLVLSLSNVNLPARMSPARRNLQRVILLLVAALSSDLKAVASPLSDRPNRWGWYGIYVRNRHCKLGKFSTSTVQFARGIPKGARAVVRYVSTQIHPSICMPTGGGRSRFRP